MILGEAGRALGKREHEVLEYFPERRFGIQKREGGGGGY